MIKNIKQTIKRKLSKKIPTSFPVLDGNLLKGRCALITGGSSGIGYSIAEAFVKNGASVVIVGRNKERITSCVKELEKCKRGGVIRGLTFDMSDIDKLGKLVEKSRSLLNGLEIDILVNNAGISSKHNFGKTDVDDFENVMKTNAESVYFLSQSFYNYMKENKIKGNILNVLSSSSKRPVSSPYMMSKWALSGLTLGMAKICIKDGIVVNAVAPGPTATRMMMQNPEDDISLSSSPIGRYIMPEEIANIAVMLVSDLGKCIVGDTVYATGGAGVITFDDIGY